MATLRDRRPILFFLAGLAVLVSIATLTALAIGPRPFLRWGGFSAADSRLVTGILVAGTPAAPVLYVTSSDPRQGGGTKGEKLPLDTNSGVVSRLTLEGGRWVRTDLVRGLPRSEHDHATNGLALDTKRGVLYVAQGGMTNMGAPSAMFGLTPEYALSASILAIDLSGLPARLPYDLPTLDDETRPGTTDAGDPFGGGQGRNQAIADSKGPVRLFATGFRNPYDIVISQTGRMYTIDNSPAWFWGAPPAVEAGHCSNAPQERGRYVPDALYRVEEGMYGGHPNPTRSSTEVTFNVTNPQSPVSRDNPRECIYSRATGPNVVTTFDTSTNGIAEYTASNFDGLLRGNLIAASIDQRIYRVRLDASGRRAISVSPLRKVDGYPLDVVAQTDGDVFPGTIWATDWLTGDILVLEPEDFRTQPHWEQRAPSGSARQEVSYVRLGSRFYLAGGGRRHEVYDPATDTWADAAPLPEDLDHVQAVATGGRIYYVGGLRGFPEPASDTVFVYDPATDSFSRGARMPRPRGAGGIGVRDGKIYYAGGLHEGKAVPWFDVYDPVTDSWSELPDMPRPRDHFQAQVVGSRFFAIGGRRSTIDSNLAENDAFDFASNRWTTSLASMPTPRGGYASAVVGREIIIFGGEAPDRTHAEVEAYDTRANTWRTLNPMPEPRHGIQAVVCAGDVYIAAGGLQPYGGSPSNIHSVYEAHPSARCALSRPRLADRATRSRTPRFRSSALRLGLRNPTSLQFGPDGRLYVAEQSGTIASFLIHRTSNGRYETLDRQTINEIRKIPNHDDDGTLAIGWDTLARLVAARVGICCDFPHYRPDRVSAEPAGPPDVARGKRLFWDLGCAECHTLSAAGSDALSGPALDHLTDLSTDYLIRAIRSPDADVVPGYLPGRMPPEFAWTMDDQQMADLVAFLRNQPEPE